MNKVRVFIIFLFMISFALVKDLFDILGNLGAAFGGNVISTVVDLVCVSFIFVFFFLQRGTVKGFVALTRKGALKTFG